MVQYNLVKQELELNGNKYDEAMEVKIEEHTIKVEHFSSIINSMKIESDSQHDNSKILITKCSSSNQQLIQEIAQHREKSYQCDHCDTLFELKGNLVKHMRTHNGGKSFQCNYCDKYYTKMSSLLRHKKLHNGEKLYQCHHCDKSFSQRGGLVIHTRTHSKEKPYQCDLCDKWFGLKSTLLSHVRTHNWEKPYQCDHCNTSFAQRSNLVKHNKRRHFTPKN